MTSLDVAERHLDLETAETNDWLPTQTVEDATPRRSTLTGLAMVITVCRRRVELGRR